MSARATKKAWYKRTREIRKAQSIAWNRSNPERRKATAELRKTTLRQIRLNLKSAPCMHCGGSFHHSAMDFHHRDRSTKDVAVSSHKALSSEKRLLAEIAKCDLLCANCHRVQTWKENNV